MTDLPEAVHNLTHPWVKIVRAGANDAYVAQEFPPLLDMLQAMVTPNSGRTRGGANDPSARSVLDVTALDLLMSIEDTARAWLIQWGGKVTTLKADVLAYHERLEALWATNAITEADYLRFTGNPESWASRIWDLIEPPLQVPLKQATCPRCDRAKWVDDDGTVTDALLLKYREGGDVQAECRWRNCDYLAVGTKALLELGFHVGATVDEETLREMGVAT